MYVDGDKQVQSFCPVFPFALIVVLLRLLLHLIFLPFFLSLPPSASQDGYIWMSYAFVVLTILVTACVAALLYYHHGNDVATMVDLYGAAALGSMYLVMLCTMIASSCGKSHGVRCCDGQRHMRRSPLRRT